LTENTELSVLGLALEPQERVQPAKGGNLSAKKRI
jgi:hypothetical protein